MTTTATKTRTATKTSATTGMDTISKGSMAVMGGASAVVGIWAAACFIGAMVSNGGPIELAKAYFSAIGAM